MTIIHLIRHGQTVSNLEKRFQGQSESHLTELGIQQAKKISATLKDIEFDAVYSSSSIRACETTAIILNGHKVKFNKMDALKEIYLGDWEAALYGEIKEKQPQQFSGTSHQVASLPTQLTPH